MYLVALVTIVIGVVGLVQPESLTAIRRTYFASPGRIVAAGAFRLAMGLVLILAASASRWPRVMRVFGALMCMQAFSAMLMGQERARFILEFETAHTELLRTGAIVALVTGIVMAFSVASRSSHTRRSILPK